MSISKGTLEKIVNRDDLQLKNLALKVFLSRVKIDIKNNPASIDGYVKELSALIEKSKDIESMQNDVSMLNSI